MNIFKEMEQLEELYSFKTIELYNSGIEYTEGQQYVLDLITDERVTVFNCFRGRRMGQSWGIVFKAIQLSNMGNKEILIANRFSAFSKYAFESFIEVMRMLKQDNKIVKASKSSGNSHIVLANGSIIKFVALSENIRGMKADYVLADNVQLSNQRLLDLMVYTTLHKKSGQVFIFPQINDRREMLEWHY